jgi:hypothetical protein
VYSNQPTTNQGSAIELGLAKDMGTAGIYFMRTLFQFDLSALANQPPVQKATLMFYENRTIAAGGLPVTTYRVTSPWTESAVTWNSKPTDDNAPIAAVSVGDNFNRGWKGFDVTALVQGWRASSYPNLGVVIRLANESTAGAYRPSWGPSRENASTSLHPFLAVEVGGHRIFGQGCGPVATWPRIDVLAGAPKINTSMTVGGRLLAPSSVSITAIGLSNTSWLGLTLPFMLDPNVGPPCQLYVAAQIQLPGATDSQGQLNQVFPIPNDQTIIGIKVYMQMATPGTLTHMTDALELTIH